MCRAQSNLQRYKQGCEVAEYITYLHIKYFLITLLSVSIYIGWGYLHKNKWVGISKKDGSSGQQN